MADRTELPSIARFTEGVAVAVERGSPLGEVLRAQAEDAREVGHRALTEAGGRKEVYMMIPAVFLMLPGTVLFAIFPGLSVLQAGLSRAEGRRGPDGWARCYARKPRMPAKWAIGH